jgi:ABC-2 type transport system permease protein
MIRALRMEWLRLRTLRSTWLITALCLTCSAGLALALGLDGRDHVDLSLAASVLNPGQPSPIAVLFGLLGVLAWGHDYRYGTIGPVLAVLPRRRELAMARVLVFTGFATGLALVTLALALGAGLAATGGALSAFLTQAPVPRMMLGSVLLAVGTGWLGLACGAWLRSLPAAVAVLFAVPALVEPSVALMLAKIDDGAENWLPFHGVGQLILLDPRPDGPAPAVGAVIYLGLLLVLIAGAVTSFVHRDL